MSQLHFSKTPLDPRVQSDAARARKPNGARDFVTATGVLAAMLAFGFLAEDVATRESFRFDTPLLLWLHSRATPFFDSLMLALTWLGGVRLLAFSILVMGVFAWRKHRARAVFCYWRWAEHRS